MPASGNIAAAKRVHTHSGAMCWAGVQSHRGDRRPAGLRRPRRPLAARPIPSARRLLKRVWNEKRQAFTGALGDDDMDASVLLLPELGLIDAHDPRFVSTVAAVEQDLVRGRHVMRYAAEDDFGLPETEFLVCRFWLIDALAAMGRREEARERYRTRSAIAQQLRPFGGRHPSRRPGRCGAIFRKPIPWRGHSQRNAAEPKLGGSLLARIFIISNRVSIPARPHPGGLEVVLKATLRKHPCVWLGWSGEVNDHPTASRPHHRRATQQLYRHRPLKPEDFDEYYNGFANRVLWPIFHYRLDLAEFSRRDLSGYLRVNEHFADELVKVLQARRHRLGA